MDELLGRIKSQQITIEEQRVTIKVLATRLSDLEAVITGIQIQGAEQVQARRDAEAALAAVLKRGES